jgi:hypothetical protein
VFVDERGGDDITLRSSVDKDPSSVAVDIAYKSEKGGFGLVDGKRRDANAFLS